MSSIYLYDCRFRDECVCFHHFHQSLWHHSLLHARHVEAIYVIPECNVVSVLLSISQSCQADVTKIGVHCRDMREANEVMEREVQNWQIITITDHRVGH